VTTVAAEIIRSRKQKVAFMPTILVIDDDPLVLTTMERLLKKNGYEVHLAADGIQGLRAFRNQRPDLVITDIIMPIKEGLDTIRLLRAWHPDTKIIAISGGGRRSNVDFLEKAAELGASAIISKPFDPIKLLTEVSRCLAP
jgi:CheY-like chemotaxis protein